MYEDNFVDDGDMTGESEGVRPMNMERELIAIIQC